MRLFVGLFGCPFFQGGQHAFLAPLLKNTPCFFTIKSVERFQPVQKVAARELRQVDFLDEWPILDCHAPNAPVNVIAAFVPKIDLAVLNDWVRPVGNVERAIGAELDVDRPEMDTPGTEYVRHLLRDVARALVADLEPDDAVRTKIAGDRVALPVVRKMRTANELESAEFRVTPRAHAVEQLRRSGVGEIHRPWHAVTEPLPPGAVRDKRLAELVVMMPPRVAEAAQENLGLERLRPQPPHTAALKPQHLVRCLHVRADVDRLVEVKPSIKPPPKRV